MYIYLNKADLQPLTEITDYKRLAGDYNPCFILKEHAPVFHRNGVSTLYTCIHHHVCIA